MTFVSLLQVASNRKYLNTPPLKKQKQKKKTKKNQGSTRIFSCRNPEYWVGLTDGEVEFVFKWLNGEALKYDGWKENEGPNSESGAYQDQDCVIISHGKMKDRKCGITNEFLCSTPGNLLLRS